jgi:hypothetical protein
MFYTSVYETPSTKGTKMKIDFTPLKRAWNENPLLVLVVGAAAASSAGKLIDSVSAAQGRRAYAKQVNHSVRRNRR